MDSLTHIALGAAIGESVLGRKVGRRAAAWGAVIAIVPDVDVVLALADPVVNFTYHRSMTHSLLFTFVAAPVFAWLIHRFHADAGARFRDWWLLCLLVLVTHALLDALTVYGTQLFWPFDLPPTMVSSIFIVDPAFTLPLLAGLGTTLYLAGRRETRPWLPNAVGLTLAASYLLWGLWSKHDVERFTQAALEAQGIEYNQILTVPTPGNSLLWRILVMSDDAYYEGFRSRFDRGRELSLTRTGRDLSPLEGIEDHWPVARLRWFIRGFYTVTVEEGFVVIPDLRMGHEPNYVFAFRVARDSNPHPIPIDAEQLPMDFQLGELGWVWRRIWDETLPPRHLEPR